MQVYFYLSWICGGVILLDGFRQPQSAWVTADRNRGFWMFWLAFASLLALGPFALVYYGLALRPRFAGGTDFHKSPVQQAPRRGDSDASGGHPPPTASLATREEPGAQTMPTTSPARVVPVEKGVASSVRASDAEGRLETNESELLERLIGHPPHAASPAFGIAPLHAGENELLSLQWSDGHTFIPAEAETVLHIWACRAIVGGVVRDEGSSDTPRDPTDPPLLNMFTGAGALTLTNRRLIGSVVAETGVLGELVAGDDRAAIFVVNLDHIVQVTLHRSKGVLGVREGGVFLLLESGGTILADFGSVVDDSRTAVRSSKRDATEAIIGAVFALRSESASPEELALLNRAVRGEWDSDGDDLVVALRPTDLTAARR